jgi:hypothetical protein
MLSVEMMVFLAFVAYLAVLASILFMSRRSSSAPILLSYPQMQSEAKTEAKTEPQPKPKIYKHTITASPNIVKTQGLLKQLEEQGISYTMTKHEKGNATIEFKTDKVLQNIEELKKKGVIIDAKIEEAKDNDPAVV